MYGFKIVDGDFAMGGDGNPRTVEGSERVSQDISCWLLEPIGSDPHYPRFGSDLWDRIGSLVNEDNLSDIRAEVLRVVQNYLTVQGQELAVADVDGLVNNWKDDDIVSRIDGIDVSGVSDTANVDVRLTTVAGDAVTVTETL